MFWSQKKNLDASSAKMLAEKRAADEAARLTNRKVDEINESIKILQEQFKQEQWKGRTSGAKTGMWDKMMQWFNSNSTGMKNSLGEIKERIRKWDSGEDNPFKGKKSNPDFTHDQPPWLYFNKTLKK